MIHSSRPQKQSEDRVKRRSPNPKALKPQIGSDIVCKIHSYEGKTILAACDKELVGRKLKRFDYEIHISEHFYKGKSVSREELKEFMQEFGNINLFGEKTVQLAIELGLITEASIILIDSIPHVVIIQL
ncbi:MAG: DUF424 family protein [Candidatus Diapherotrites archaeon]|nr:DUF424 family protein [Candidatus Diapherotrites archaeon]